MDIILEIILFDKCNALTVEQAVFLELLIVF
jgi:hypothetical protein